MSPKLWLPTQEQPLLFSRGVPLGLFVVATLSFVLLWNRPQPLAGQVQPVVVAPATPLLTGATTEAAPRLTGSIPLRHAEAVWLTVGRVGSTQLPLPQGISAGRYRVIEADGAVSSCTVTPEQAQGRSDRRVFEWREGEQTRVFVRIGDAMKLSVASRPALLSQSQPALRKFDFTGYTTSVSPVTTTAAVPRSEVFPDDLPFVPETRVATVAEETERLPVQSQIGRDWWRSEIMVADPPSEDVSPEVLPPVTRTGNASRDALRQ